MCGVYLSALCSLSLARCIMIEYEVCEGCGTESVAFDPGAGLMVCETCGLVRQETEFRRAEFDKEGEKVGTYVGGRGTATSVGGFGRPGWAIARGVGFKCDRKKKHIMSKLGELAALLHLPKDKADDVKHMLKLVTEDKWGAGHWMDVLVGTCIYIVARQNHLPLSAAEISATLNCNVKEILRMYHQVLDLMGLQSPAIDHAVYFDRIISHSPAFMSMERDTIRQLSKQGHCLLQCGADWFLSTGRHPLAVVAAVVVIVGRANNIKVDMEEVSRDLHVNPETSRLRLKEFLESLVGIGQSLPWGKDITARTVNRHLPFLLQYLQTRMKMDASRVSEKEVNKSKAARKETTLTEAAAVRHLAKALCAKYGKQIRCVLDSQPFDVASEDSDLLSKEATATGLKRRKVDGDASAHDNSPCSKEEGVATLGNCLQTGECSKQAATCLEACEFVGDQEKTKTLTAGGGHHPSGTWKPLPPSFLANGSAESTRFSKIEAAKKRIATVKQEMANQLKMENGQVSLDEKPVKPVSMPSPMKLYAESNKGLDSEDFLIQYCLIRGANEELLKAGYYRLVLSTPPVQPDVEILSDWDLLKFFRTPREIEFLQSLSKEETLYPWLTKDELDSQT